MNHHRRRLVRSSTASACIAYLSAMLTYTLILLVLPEYCLSKNATPSNIYRESESKYPPSECYRSIRPTHFLEDTADAYRLVVNIPQRVSRRNLKIDIDHNEGQIVFFGWWMERKVRGEAPKKLCVYKRWLVDPDLLSEEAILSNDLVSVYEISMSIQDQQLILSLPIDAERNLSTSTSPPPPSPILNEDNKEEEIVNHASIVIAYGTTLWKKIRGLARLNDSLNYSNNSTNSTLSLSSSSSWDIDDIGLPPTLVYLKSRQDALEHFLKFSLAAIDKESYW